MLSVARDAVSGLRTITFNLFGVRRPDAPSAAAAVRVPMLFTGAVATGAHPPPQCDPGRLRPRRASRAGRRREDGRGPLVRSRIPPPGLAGAGVRKVRALRALR